MTAMGLKLAVQENLVPGDDLLAKWEILRAIGYDAIELRGSAGMRDRLPELRAAREAGAVFSSICVISDRFIGDFDVGRRVQRAWSRPPPTGCTRTDFPLSRRLGRPKKTVPSFSTCWGSLESTPPRAECSCSSSRSIAMRIIWSTRWPKAPSSAA
jgi:hypothetical protein